MCYLKKIISSDITAFEPGTLTSLHVEHVGNVTVDFYMISMGGRIFGNFFATRKVCIVIHAEIGKNFTGMTRAGILNELEVRNVD